MKEPRNVRNFWAEIMTEGRTIATGPRRAHEPLEVTLYVRESGGVRRAFTLKGWHPTGDPTALHVTFTDPSGGSQDFEFTR